jgi:hypothetical protein
MTEILQLTTFERELTRIAASNVHLDSLFPTRTDVDRGKERVYGVEYSKNKNCSIPVTGKVNKAFMNMM